MTQILRQFYANMYQYCWQKSQIDPTKKQHWQQRQNFYQKLYLQIND